jgi:hypothetical protein
VQCSEEGGSFLGIGECRVRQRSRNRQKFGKAAPAWRDAYRIPSADGNQRCSARLQSIVVSYCLDIAIRLSSLSVFWTVGSSSG